MQERFRQSRFVKGQQGSPVGKYYFDQRIGYRYAYIEFVDKESSIKAKHLNESLFKGRQLTVLPKRKNERGMGRGGGMGRGRGTMAIVQ